MFAGFLFLILLAGGESSNDSCSHRDILKHLKLKDSALYAITRPVSNHSSSLEVVLDVLLYAILDVNEKDQKFVSYVWVDMSWKDDYISWNPEEFCDIKAISLPTKVLWKPDLTIEEMTEKDKASQSPYLLISSKGRVSLRNDMMVISTCKMQVYKFPFDIQSCNLTFKSVIHSVQEMHFVQLGNSSITTEWSRVMMRSQSEWVFINMEISNKTVDNFGIVQSMLVYTINMKRRSVLYVVNFMLPILFFLCLDFASFLVSDSGGEKLSFKVTVMLAVTVMQLILNEILPSSSDYIPLIATYCIGIFGLMLLSLLETILVMYLMEKDNEADEDRRLGEDSGDKQGKGCFPNGFNSEIPSGLLPVTTEGSSSQLKEEPRDFEKLSEDLRQVVKTLTELLNSRKDKGEPGYWTKKTKTINKVFFIFYLIAVILFLVFMHLSWN